MRLSFDLGTLVLHDPPEGFRPPACFHWDGRVDRWRAQAHHYRAILEQFKQARVQCDNTAPAYRTLKLSSRLTQAPHPFQSEALAAWKDAGRRGVVVLPTGAGKSYPGEMYSHAAEMCLAPYRLGLTATPERADGRHVLLDELIGPQVYAKGIKELAGDYLADYVVERIKVTLTPAEEEEYRRARSTFS